MNTITIPSFMEDFTQTNLLNFDESLIEIEGELDNEERICPYCGSKLHSHDVYETSLKHLPYGKKPIKVNFKKRRYECPSCKAKVMQNVSFQAEGHRITKALYTYACHLLSKGLTNKHVAMPTGLGRNTVKEIDKERLEKLYCNEDGSWKVPTERPKAIGIDEFLLRKGHKYATVIMSMETGSVLYLAEGKKKHVVYDFISYVGDEWMKSVEVVCCDMNSDFFEAFKDKCPNIQILFDYFHIKKNFNDKVISKLRTDECNRLTKEGKLEEAASLKRSRFILTSSRSTLVNGKKENLIRYEDIIKENTLLFTADLVKEKLSYAYSLRDEEEMKKEVNEIISICRETENKHFSWFAKLLDSHIDGIITHATYNLSSGKVEGTNNKIKTIRRQSYGLPDKDYFFLKVFDATRQPKWRGEESPNIYA